MKVHQTLICFFFLTLRDGETLIFDKDIGVRTGTEGKHIRVGCTFNFSGKKKMFCRNDCDKGILVETDGVRASSGRYSIEYEESVSTIYVSITNLMTSDSGKYKCYMKRGFSPDSSETFELKVNNVSKPTETLQPSPAWTTTSSTQRSSSTTGDTKTPSLSSESTEESLQQTPGSGSSDLLYLGLVLLLLLIVLSAVLLILYRKRKSRKPKGPPVQTEYANIQEVNRVYEEVREDRKGRSPVDVSTVYMSATFAKPNNGPTVDYSLITLPSSHDKTEDDSRNLTYSEVDFSHNEASSLSSAPSGGVDNVIYSDPRVEAPLYSTVTSR